MNSSFNHCELQRRTELLRLRLAVIIASLYHLVVFHQSLLRLNWISAGHVLCALGVLEVDAAIESLHTAVSLTVPNVL